MCLLESVATLFEGAIKRFHWLWLCKIVSERKLHGTEVGPALFGAGCLWPAVMVVDAPRGRRGAPRLLVAVQFLRQVGQVGGHLFVSQWKQFIMRRIKYFLNPVLLKAVLHAMTFFRGCFTCTKIEIMRRTKTIPDVMPIIVPWVLVICSNSPAFFFSAEKEKQWDFENSFMIPVTNWQNIFR